MSLSCIQRSHVSFVYSGGSVLFRVISSDKRNEIDSLEQKRML